MYLSLYIINKAGGLIYQKDLSSSALRLSGNDYLRLGSTFHGLHTISAQIAPVPSDGIASISTDTFTLACLHTLTGTKFFVTAEPGTSDLDFVLSSVYELYSDYVLKNPFYEIDMPIRCERFNIKLRQLIQKLNTDTTGRRRHTVLQD